MSMLGARYRWSTLASSGRVTAINVEQSGALEWALVVSSPDSTVTVNFDIGLSSAGPWLTLASTTTGSTGFAARMAVTGPLPWVAPRLTGVSNTNGVSVELTGVG